MRNSNQMISKKYETNYKYESKIYLPNELFEKLIALKEQKKTTSSHLPYVFSYLYYQIWLYTYAKYDNYIPTMDEIKEDLGYSKTNKRINYITTKDGLLDSEGLTITTRDFPITTDKEKIKGKIDKSIFTISDCMNEFEMEQYYAMRNINVNTTCKKPLFLIHRDNIEHFDGTLNDIYNTTMIDISVFDFCMSKSNLGVTAFYIYSFLKYKNDKFKEGYDASHNRLAKEMGLTPSTVQKYRDALRSYNLIELVHNMPHYLPEPKDHKASTNIVNDAIEFSAEKVEYVKFHEQKGKKKIDKNKENHIEFLPSGDNSFIWFTDEGLKLDILESQLPY